MISLSRNASNFHTIIQSVKCLNQCLALSLKSRLKNTTVDTCTSVDAKASKECMYIFRPWTIDITVLELITYKHKFIIHI